MHHPGSGTHTGMRVSGPLGTGVTGNYEELGVVSEDQSLGLCRAVHVLSS